MKCHIRNNNHFGPIVDRASHLHPHPYRINITLFILRLHPNKHHSLTQFSSLFFFIFLLYFIITFFFGFFLFYSYHPLSCSSLIFLLVFFFHAPPGDPSGNGDPRKSYGTLERGSSVAANDPSPDASMFLYIFFFFTYFLLFFFFS